MMKTEVSMLRKENTKQQNVISNLTKKTVSLTKDAPVKLEIPVGKSTMERDPTEEKKILDILKNMDDDNAKAKELAAVEAAKTVKKAKKARAPKRAKKAVVAEAATPIQASVVKKVAKTKAPKKAKKARAPKKTVVEAVEESVVAEIAENEPFFANEDAETADEALKIIEAAEDSFREALAETTKEAAVIEELKSYVAKPEEVDAPAKTEATKTKAPRKKKGAATAPASDNANPWGVLKESTLKRKTIAQLTAYLNERKVDVEGFSKAELVGTIQKL
jgi:hypothetical protein